MIEETDDDATRTPPESPMGIAQAFYARAGLDMPVEHVEELAVAIHQYGDQRAGAASQQMLELADKWPSEEAIEKAIAERDEAADLRPSLWSRVPWLLIGACAFAAGMAVGQMVGR